MAPTPPLPARRRTAERVLGALLVVAGLSLAFIAYSAFAQPGGRQGGNSLLRPLATPPAVAGGQAAAGGSQATPDSSQGADARPGQGASGVPLVVLDNTARPELARSASHRFEQGGWTVTDTNTFDGDILSTAAYYDPAAPGAQAAAEALRAQFPEIQRVRPKFDGLGPGPVIVVLTHDYSQGQTTS